MSISAAINGFGRIGRLTLRAILENNRQDIDVVAANSRADAKTMAHLLKYDSVHGPLQADVTHGDDWIGINGKKIKYTRNSDASENNWQGVDVVMECSGKLNNRDASAIHLACGAKYVLVSAPCTNADATIVYGVNEDVFQPNMQVVSNASCTTNCLAPVAKILHDNLGIKNGYMTTIHAYTGDQNTIDASHKDLRRARTAACSIIPTSTGAAKNIGLVIPDLKGRLDGTAIRVPTPNVSCVDLTLNVEKPTSAQQVNDMMLAAASSEKLKNILAINSEDLVSVDFNKHPASSIFDTTQTQVIDGNLVRILAWYDNEWGFSCRMADLAVYMLNRA